MIDIRARELDDAELLVQTLSRLPVARDPRRCIRGFLELQEEVRSEDSGQRVVDGFDEVGQEGDGDVRCARGCVLLKPG